MKKTLSKRDIRELNAKIFDSTGKVDFFSKKDAIEIIDNSYYLHEGKLLFFIHGNTILPSLQLLQTETLLKAITVDMGAVKFVVNGADIMRPGITSFDQTIEQDDYVAIVDETHKKPLAVGQSLLGTEELQKTSSGKAVKNIHYIGDDIWNISTNK